MARVFLSISASVSCRNPPTSSHPRRPTHVLPPTSSGFPAFRTPAGRRTHDPARRAFLPRREGAGQAPGALCSVVEGRGRRHPPAVLCPTVSWPGPVPRLERARCVSSGSCSHRLSDLGSAPSHLLSEVCQTPSCKPLFHFISKPFWSPLGSQHLAQAAAPWVGPSLLSWSLISQNLPRISQYLFCLLEIILI